MSFPQTQDEKWATRVSGILDASEVFFSPDVPNVMYEVACEPSNNCNVDQRSFKAYLARWMAATTKVAPWTYQRVMDKLRPSALAAANICTGGASGQMCGQKWYTGQFDGSTGVGEQMSALEVVQSNLISYVDGPVTNTIGGMSPGNPFAGQGGDPDPASNPQRITTGDRVGAGFLTTLIVVGVVGGAVWMVA